MESVVNSLNLFIDSERGIETNDGNKGDDFKINLNGMNIDANNGQTIRLSITDFNMYKTFTNVNTNNSRFSITTNNTDASLGTVPLDLPHKNHENIRDIATDFANTLATYLFTQKITSSTATKTTVDVTNPASDAGIAGTSSNIISVKVTFKNGSDAAVAHGINKADIHFYEKSPTDDTDSDIFTLLGGNVIRDNTDTTTNSITTTIGTNDITFTCLYPAQRFTESFVYLRTNLPTKNIATSSLDAGKLLNAKENSHHTNILARFPIDTEVVSYKSNIDREYFVDVPFHHMTNIRFYLTDHHGRSIPSFGTNQKTLGNFSFSMTCRVDVIQKIKPNETKFGEVQHNYPKRFENVIVKENAHTRF